MPLAPLFKQVVTYFALSLGVLVLVGCSSSEERAENHYKRGLELVEESELTKASLEFRNALKLNSDHVDALFAFGEIQERQREIQAAYRVYTAVAEQDPNHIPVRLKLTYMLLSANQTEQARKFLDEALALDAEAPEIKVAKATYELKSGNHDAAEQIAKEVLKAEPGSKEALVVLASSRIAAEDPAGALEYLDSASEEGKDDIGFQVLRLSVLETLGDDARIDETFADLVERFPDTPQFNQTWTQWHLSKGRTDKAEEIIRRYAADRSDDDVAQLNLVSFLISRRGNDVAQTELETIIKTRQEAGGDTFPFKVALGQMHFVLDRQDEAIDLMRTVLSETDDAEQKIQARIVLATILIQNGNYARADELVNEVIEEDDKNVEALRLRATIKLSNNDSAGAVDDILLSLNEAPNDARLRVMLAGAYERNGSTILAEEQYAKALVLDNNSPEAGLPMVQFLFRHGKAEQAERVLESIRERHPTNRQVLNLVAQQRLARQDWVGAQEIADILRNTDESDNSAFADRITAAALGGQDKHDESLDLLKNSMTTPEDEARLLPDLVRAYVQAGKQGVAIDHLNSVLAKEPDNVLAQVLLGSVVLSEGRTEEAEERLKSAAAIEGSVLGNTSLAQFYFATGKLEEADAAIRSGLAKDENNTALRLMLTSVLQQTEKFDEAIEEYEKLFKADPDSTIVANDLASLLSERRGDEASLERAFEIAQRFRTSEVPHYLDTLGWIYYLRGEYSSALPLLRNAAEKLPNLGLAQFHYGMTLAALNQKEQAITSLEKSLDLKTLMTEKDFELARSTVERLKSPEPQTKSN
ncbi:tetratricopeptide (TPR) repeat protein [Labrenzia sp. EL_208]|nr:tetratricopeptide (TPR) repeat protein [Labrenzia sp. EL_132]MBG6230813.1 tetratricopeptide (TPR) repeat protein [Labrenzia sp. EL_208]